MHGNKWMSFNVLQYYFFIHNTIAFLVRFYKSAHKSMKIGSNRQENELIL